MYVPSKVALGRACGVYISNVYVQGCICALLNKLRSEMMLVLLHAGVSRSVIACAILHAENSQVAPLVKNILVEVEKLALAN